MSAKDQFSPWKIIPKGLRWGSYQLQHLAIKDYGLALHPMMHRTQVKGTPPV
ncbi:MAG: hypothetical protein ACI9W2_004659 [Gammaproteobacteria bacterium]|jgi:hypothetical protein